MDPYLEGPLWSSIHAQFCSEIARRLTPALGDRYIALVEERLVVESLDDVSIATRAIRPEVSVATTQTRPATSATIMEAPLQLATVVESELPMHFIEIRSVPNMVVVTVLEVLSPANKEGEGRADYLRKRRSVLNSDVNLIEIDLLRGGRRVPMRDPLPDFPYFALIHRASTRPVADVWPIGLRDRLPSIPVPLLAPDADVELNLQAAFTGAYDSVGYGRAIDYAAPLSPPLPEIDAEWARGLLQRPK
jgi:hypothetical protein